MPLVREELLPHGRAKLAGLGQEVCLFHRLQRLFAPPRCNVHRGASRVICGKRGKARKEGAAGHPIPLEKLGRQIQGAQNPYDLPG